MFRALVLLLNASHCRNKAFGLCSQLILTTTSTTTTCLLQQQQQKQQQQRLFKRGRATRWQEAEGGECVCVCFATERTEVRLCQVIYCIQHTHILGNFHRCTN